MTFLIRKSTDADLASVIQWLKEEHEKCATGFFCNRDVITAAHSNKEMIVLVINGSPVAFLANGLGRDGILEVRKDRRGRGYGKALAEEGLRQAIADDDVCVLDIQCAPSSSIPFWEGMGFTIYSGDYASRNLPRTLALPAAGKDVELEIREHLDPAQHYPETSIATQFFKPHARRGEDGNIYLEERIIFGRSTSFRDMVARIIVDGEDRFFNKLKYDEAAECGVCRDKYGNFYIDCIYVRSSSK
jgi:GNAT superfamily N-acetyltransferase